MTPFSILILCILKMHWDFLEWRTHSAGHSRLEWRQGVETSACEQLLPALKRTQKRNNRAVPVINLVCTRVCECECMRALDMSTVATWQDVYLGTRGGGCADESVRVPSAGERLWAKDLGCPSTWQRYLTLPPSALGLRPLRRLPGSDGDGADGSSEVRSMAEVLARTKLRRELYPHQVFGVWYMLTRELEEGHGGLLADDMGLGKTRQALALVQCSRALARELPALSPALRPTLVVCTLPLLPQWRRECVEAIGISPQRVVVVHGPSRSVSVNDLRRATVVLTTYATLRSLLHQPPSASSECDELHALAKTPFHRVIADESQCVRNSRSQVHEALLAVCSGRSTGRCRLALPLEVAGKGQEHKGSEASSSAAMMRAYVTAGGGKARTDDGEAEGRTGMIVCARTSVWLLSGTPLSNSITDLAAQCKLLGVTPYNRMSFWRTARQDSYEFACWRRRFLLRRTKTELVAQGKTHGPAVIPRSMARLSGKTVEVVMVPLSPVERALYTGLCRGTQHTLRAWRNAHALPSTQASLRMSLLAAIQRLMSGGLLHPLLLRGDVAGNAFAPPAAVAAYSAQQERLQREVEASTATSAMCKVCARSQRGTELLGCGHRACPDCLQLSSQRDWKASCLLCAWTSAWTLRRGREYPVSSRVAAVVARARMVVAAGTRVVLFSKFRGFLDVLEVYLLAAGVPSLRYDGSLTPQQRTFTLARFCSGGRGGSVGGKGTAAEQPRVLLATMTAGGVGLNLEVAQEVWMVDHHFNPAVELQAIDRVHRIGQRREVTVVSFHTPHSTDDWVCDMQAGKRRVMDRILSSRGSGAVQSGDVPQRALREVDFTSFATFVGAWMSCEDAADAAGQPPTMPWPCSIETLRSRLAVIRKGGLWRGMERDLVQREGLCGARETGSVRVRLDTPRSPVAMEGFTAEEDALLAAVDDALVGPPAGGPHKRRRVENEE